MAIQKKVLNSKKKTAAPTLRTEPRKRGAVDARGVKKSSLKNFYPPGPC